MMNRTTLTLLVLATTGTSPLVAAQPSDVSSAGISVEEKSLESDFQSARDLLKANQGEDSLEKGFQMMLAAAEKGHLQAIAGVAYLYNVGMGTPKDNTVAAKWFRLAAEKEHAISQYNLGKLLVADEVPLPEGTADRKTQHEEGVDWIRKAADQGVNEAQNSYGIILYRGDFDVKRDRTSAVGYLKPAAEAGVLEAMNALGMIYWTGNGTPRNPDAAQKLLRRAAMAGHVKAQANLGEILNLLSQNPVQRIEGLAWLYIAEEAGDPVAKKIAAIKSQAISPDDLAAARSKAAEIQREISEKTR